MVPAEVPSLPLSAALLCFTFHPWSLAPVLAARWQQNTNMASTYFALEGCHLHFEKKKIFSCDCGDLSHLFLI